MFPILLLPKKDFFVTAKIDQNNNVIELKNTILPTYNLHYTNKNDYSLNIKFEVKYIITEDGFISFVDPERRIIIFCKLYLDGSIDYINICNFPKNVIITDLTFVNSDFIFICTKLNFFEISTKNLFRFSLILRVLNEWEINYSKDNPNIQAISKNYSANFQYLLTNNHDNTVFELFKIYGVNEFLKIDKLFSLPKSSKKEEIKALIFNNDYLVILSEDYVYQKGVYEFITIFKLDNYNKFRREISFNAYEQPCFYDSYENSDTNSSNFENYKYKDIFICDNFLIILSFDGELSFCDFSTLEFDSKFHKIDTSPTLTLYIENKIKYVPKKNKIFKLIKIPSSDKFLPIYFKNIDSLYTYGYKVETLETLLKSDFDENLNEIDIETETELPDSNNYFDKYNIHGDWGGLYGQEAIDGYWNTE